MKRFTKTIVFIIALSIALSACSNNSSSTNASKKTNKSYRKFFYSSYNGGKTKAYLWKGTNEKPTLIASDKAIIQATKKYVVLMETENGLAEIGKNNFLVLSRPDFKKVYEGKDPSTYLQTDCIEECALSFESKFINNFRPNSSDDYTDSFYSEPHKSTETIQDILVEDGKIYQLKSDFIKETSTCVYSSRQIDQITQNILTEFKKIAERKVDIRDGVSDIQQCDWKFGRFHNEYVETLEKDGAANLVSVFDGDGKQKFKFDFKKSDNLDLVG